MCIFGDYGFLFAFGDECYDFINGSEFCGSSGIVLELGFSYEGKTLPSKIRQVMDALEGELMTPADEPPRSELLSEPRHLFPSLTDFLPL